jgi:hypothetical protein
MIKIVSHRYRACLLLPVLGLLLTAFITPESFIIDNHPISENANNLPNIDRSFDLFIDFTIELDFDNEVDKQFESDHVVSLSDLNSDFQYLSNLLIHNKSIRSRQILFQTDSSPPVC